MVNSYSQQTLAGALEGEVHVWFCKYDLHFRADDATVLSSVLSASEYERYNCFHFDRDRHQFLVSRVMLRHILSAYREDVAPNAWRFEQNECGKPHIAGDQCRGDLYFNLSHTNGLIVLAVFSYPWVGVDIEMSTGRPRALSLTKYVLTPAEQRIYETLDEYGKRKRFYCLWTLKEAYVKALGTGLSTPMTSFGFYLNTYGEPMIADSNGFLRDNNHWRFYQASVSNEYSMALAYWLPEKRADVTIGADLRNGEYCMQKKIPISQLPEFSLCGSQNISVSKFPFR